MSREFQYCPFCGQSVELKTLKVGEPKRHFCSQCDFIHFQSLKLAAGVLFCYEGKIVLSRRSIEPGFHLWSYPGGFVEIGETAPQAAAREALEEVCAEVKIQGLLGVYTYSHSHVAIVMYRGESVGSKPKIGDEVSEVEFFLPDEIPWEELAFSSVRDSIKDYIAWTSL